jgi:streptomycin 3"-adenylyltransferase
MWLTAATGEISAKDHAAEWAAERLPKNQAELVDMARQAYLGKAVDKWEGLDASLTELVGKMQQAIEALLNGC